MRSSQCFVKNTGIRRNRRKMIQNIVCNLSMIFILMRIMVHLTMLVARHINQLYTGYLRWLYFFYYLAVSILSILQLHNQHKEQRKWELEKHLAAENVN